MRQAKKDLFMLVLTAFCGALAFALQLALTQIINVELVTVTLMAFTGVFGRKGLGATAVYVGLNFLTYGFPVSMIGYAYAWPLLWLITCAVRKSGDIWIIAFTAGVFGLFFGTLLAIADGFIYGWTATFAYWIRGLPYDVIHCVSNFITVSLLYKPLSKIFEQGKKYT